MRGLLRLMPQLQVLAAMLRVEEWNRLKVRGATLVELGTLPCRVLLIPRSIPLLVLGQNSCAGGREVPEPSRGRSVLRGHRGMGAGAASGVGETSV